MRFWAEVGVLEVNLSSQCWQACTYVVGYAEEHFKPVALEL